MRTQRERVFFLEHMHLRHSYNYASHACYAFPLFLKSKVFAMHTKVSKLGCCKADHQTVKFDSSPKLISSYLTLFWKLTTAHRCTSNLAVSRWPSALAVISAVSPNLSCMSWDNATQHRDCEWPQLSPLHHAVNTVMAHTVLELTYIIMIIIMKKVL